MGSPTLVRFFDSVFLREADLAVRRAQAAKRRGDPVVNGGASFTAIATSVAGAEAYLSEMLAHQQETRLLTPKEREHVRSGKSLPNKFKRLLDAWRVQKFHVRPVYSDFCALVALRHALMHRSAEFLKPGTWPRDLAPHRGRIPHVSGEKLDWTSQVLDARTASWARSTAKKFLKAVQHEIPDPGVFGT